MGFNSAFKGLNAHTEDGGTCRTKGPYSAPTVLLQGQKECVDLDGLLTYLDGLLTRSQYLYL